MIFAAEFFSHAISAALAFAAFARADPRARGAEPRPLLVAAAGLLAGLAVTFEVQVGLVGVVLFVYAVARRRPAAPRGAPTAPARSPARSRRSPSTGGCWARRCKLAYGDAVAEIGRTGHAEIGLNDDGFFGITLPRLDAAIDLLLGGRGLLVLTPVVVDGGRRGACSCAAAATGPRRGRSSASAVAYFLYNIGYWQPYGGGTPGPRFLIPALPFLALGLAFAYRRLPATTLALAVPSALWMLVASLTYPLIGEQGTGLLGRACSPTGGSSTPCSRCSASAELARDRSRSCSRSRPRSGSRRGDPAGDCRASRDLRARGRRARGLGRRLGLRAVDRRGPGDPARRRPRGAARGRVARSPRRAAVLAAPLAEPPPSGRRRAVAGPSSRSATELVDDHLAEPVAA